jgi:enoyl-CoA hydratase/carnithine racemase
VQRQLDVADRLAEHREDALAALLTGGGHAAAGLRALTSRQRRPLLTLVAAAVADPHVSGPALRLPREAHASRGAAAVDEVQRQLLLGAAAPDESVRRAAGAAPTGRYGRRMPSLSRRGDVFVLDLGDGENRFNPTWVAAVEQALVEVQETAGPRALVTTATGKFWSNGLDLEWMAAHPEESAGFLGQVHGLLAHVLGAEVATVAAVQGHAFAAGAMLAVAHDRVVVREDRGYWCVPEVDIGLPFTPGMSALLQARLPAPTAHEAMTTGRRYGGPDAVAAGIAASAHPLDEVVDTAVAWAAAHAGKDPATLGAIKRQMYAPVLQALGS